MPARNRKPQRQSSPDSPQEPQSDLQQGWQSSSGPPAILPRAERVLLSLHEYQLVRQRGEGLQDYDILMRNPGSIDVSGRELSETDRWSPVPAVKYLKHRALEWREADSLDELPEPWRALADGREPFPPPA